MKVTTNYTNYTNFEKKATEEQRLGAKLDYANIYHEIHYR